MTREGIGLAVVLACVHGAAFRVRVVCAGGLGLRAGLPLT
jgi:hypothetical protein